MNIEIVRSCGILLTFQIYVTHRLQRDPSGEYIMTKMLLSYRGERSSKCVKSVTS